MKDRIKKFCKDHEEALAVMAGAFVATVIGAYVTIKKIENDNAVYGLHEVNSPKTGMRFVDIYQKNGRKTTFDNLDPLP